MGLHNLYGVLALVGMQSTRDRVQSTLCLETAADLVVHRVWSPCVQRFLARGRRLCSPVKSSAAIGVTQSVPLLNRKLRPSGTIAYASHRNNPRGKTFLFECYLLVSGQLL